ncbi:MAG: hypothetical protein KY469_15600 [Actinobacteria bacterium]|nr:hypothetical protein [Actinomycetota bacterium]
MAFWRRRKRAEDAQAEVETFESFTATKPPERTPVAPRVETHLFPLPTPPGPTRPQDEEPEPEPEPAPEPEPLPVYEPEPEPEPEPTPPEPEPAPPEPEPAAREPEPAPPPPAPPRPRPPRTAAPVETSLEVTVHDERLQGRSTPLDLTPSEAIVLARDGRHGLRRKVGGDEGTRD